MRAVLSLLVAACLADRIVSHRNSSSINSSSNVSSNQSASKVASSNHSALEAVSSNQSALKDVSSSRSALQAVSSNQSASKVVSSNQSALKVVSSNQSTLKAVSNQSSLKVAKKKKSHEELQSEVHKLQQENKRLRGLLKNTTQKNTTSATVLKSKNATHVEPAGSPSKHTAVPVASANKHLDTTTSDKHLDAKPATTASVEAVNHALDAAVRKPAKAKKNATEARVATRNKLRAAIKALDRDEADIARIEKETEKEEKEASTPAKKENKKVTPAAHVETNIAKDAALEKKADKVIHLLKDEEKGASHSARGKKLLRQLVAPPAETMKPMIKTFKDMIAKLEKLNKHDGDENRMAFCENIAKDLVSCEEPFKDHEGITYKEHSASECLGVRGPFDADLKSDSADECQTKCNDLGPECAGFMHATSGPDAGTCYFKKGGIKDVETSDKSTCFEKEDPRDPLVKKFVSLNLWVLEQASNEINWICQSGFRSTREENRVEAFRLVIQTYMDGIQCQPGDIPCPGGTISGEKPMCECTQAGK